MNKQKLKGLWIPAEILLNTELTDKEKLILSIILYLSKDNDNCFASNRYIANIVNVTPDRVSKIISSLKNKKYINVKLKYKKESKEIESRQIELNKYSQKYPQSIVENNTSNSQKNIVPIDENDKDIINIKSKNNYNNKYYTNKKYLSYKSDRNYDNFDWSSLYANLKEVNSN